MPRFVPKRRPKLGHRTCMDASKCMNMYLAVYPYMAIFTKHAEIGVFARFFWDISGVFCANHARIWDKRGRIWDNFAFFGTRLWLNHGVYLVFFSICPKINKEIYIYIAPLVCDIREQSYKKKLFLFGTRPSRKKKVFWAASDDPSRVGCDERRRSSGYNDILFQMRCYIMTQYDIIEVSEPERRGALPLSRRTSYDSDTTYTHGAR